jgi:hypothetical protein
MDERFSKFIADASALVALGAVAAILGGKLFHLGVDDSLLGFWGSIGGFGTTVVWKSWPRRARLEELLDRLTMANHLFLSGHINEAEWRSLRFTGIQRFK